MGFEPTTPTLARLCSTPELHPHPSREKDIASASADANSGGTGLSGSAACRRASRALETETPRDRSAFMPASPEDLFAYLDRLGIATTTVSHEPLFTVEQSRGLHQRLAGAHTKNLFLIDKKGQLFLVVAEKDAEIDLKHLHRRIGASGRLSFGRAERLRETLGVEPGSVTPFGAINDRNGSVRVFLDETLAMHELINCHPLVNTRTTQIATVDLLRFLRETGHEPRIVAVTGQAADGG
jgi:Ala-tRNA(Pro) deacylase